jgi:hypothetical protein
MTALKKASQYIGNDLNVFAGVKPLESDKSMTL